MRSVQNIYIIPIISIVEMHHNIIQLQGFTYCNNVCERDRDR